MDTPPEAGEEKFDIAESGEKIVETYKNLDNVARQFIKGLRWVKPKMGLITDTYKDSLIRDVNANINMLDVLKLELEEFRKRLKARMERSNKSRLYKIFLNKPLWRNI